jgi:hypothetical protein
MFPYILYNLWTFLPSSQVSSCTCIASVCPCICLYFMPWFCSWSSSFTCLKFPMVFFSLSYTSWYHSTFRIFF